MKRIACLTISILAATAGCKSYEDAFNRNLNSTGLYVANSGSNTVSMFAADPKSGILNDLGTVAAGTTPVHVAVNSAGTFAYVVNSGSDDVYVYSIDSETRKLTFKSSTSTGDNPRMIALHATKNFAYVVNEGSTNISGFTMDSTTGALTAMASSPFTSGATTPRALAVASGTNSYVFVTDATLATPRVFLFDISASTGGLSAHTTASETICTAALPNSVSVFDGTTTYITVPCSDGTLKYFTLSGWNGSLTPTSIAAGTNPIFALINSDRSTALVSNSGSANLSVYSMSSGVLTAAGTVSACTTPAQVLVNSSSYAYVVCNGENKINAYSLSGTSLSLVGSYATGSTPTSVAGY